MDARKKQYGPLRAGEAITTTAGGVTCCRKIIHTAGPT